MSMPKNFRLKFLFIVSTCFLLLFAVLRYLTDFFIDEETLKASFKKNIYFLIISAILLGILYIFFFRRVFPKGWETQSSSGKIGISLIILILSFAVTWQNAITLNLVLPSTGKELLSGKVVSKNIEKTSKGTKFYTLSISTAKSEKIRVINVSNNIFDHYKEGDSIHKQMHVGFMGIKYLPY